MSKRRIRHEPENLGARQAARDRAAGPSRRYYVYVLETDCGHYVGHTARPQARLWEHRTGQSWSTAGTNPRRIWQSRPFRTRDEAAHMEAALKTMRDQRVNRYQEIVGHEPIPWSRPLGDMRRKSEEQKHSSLMDNRTMAIVAVVAALVFVIWATR